MYMVFKKYKFGVDFAKIRLAIWSPELNLSTNFLFIPYIFVGYMKHVKGTF